MPAFLAQNSTNTFLGSNGLLTLFNLLLAFLSCWLLPVLACMRSSTGMRADNKLDGTEKSALGQKQVSFAEAFTSEEAVGGNALTCQQQWDAAAGQSAYRSTPANSHIVVPLSSIPEISGIVPTSSTILSNERYNYKNRSLLSSSSSSNDVLSTGDSSAVRSSKSVVSNAISAVKLKVNNPRQVSEKPTRYHRVLAWVGRVGWCGKAVVYALIGEL